MSLRWYSTVIDSQDVATLGRWWQETLGWQQVYESETEYVIVPNWVSEELARDTPWEQLGPGLVFVPVPEGKTVKNRLHIDLAPHSTDDRDALIGGLQARGATASDVGQSEDASWTVLHDPEGNEFCVLSARDL